MGKISPEAKELHALLVRELGQDRAQNLIIGGIVRYEKSHLVTQAFAVGLRYIDQPNQVRQRVLKRLGIEFKSTRPLDEVLAEVEELFPLKRDAREAKAAAQMV